MGSADRRFITQLRQNAGARITEIFGEKIAPVATRNMLMDSLAQNAGAFPKRKFDELLAFDAQITGQRSYRATGEGIELR
jgi:hypothetical protein